MSSSEAAEFSKLADTTYRDVNIALANEFARDADLHGIDVQEVIAAANSQPYSHIHQPGIGVGGHCIPVYPHLLLAARPASRSSRPRAASTTARSTGRSRSSTRCVGGLAGAPVLVLGVTYREGVKELAYSRAIAADRRASRRPGRASPPTTRSCPTTRSRRSAPSRGTGASRARSGRS